jgi:hypothetical protein
MSGNKSKQREKRMSSAEEREPMKHDLSSEPGFGASEPPPFAQPPDPVDSLRLLDKVSRLPAIRMEQVQRMRELIAADQFETPERVDGTVRRLMEELGL